MRQLEADLESMALPLTWGIIAEALAWPPSTPLLTAEAVQHHAAELVGRGAPDADEALPIAILRSDDTEATASSVAELARSDRFGLRDRQLVVVLVALRRELAAVDPADPVESAARLLGWFAGADPVSTLPRTVEAWRHGDAGRVFTPTGCVELMREVHEWIEGSAAGLRTRSARADP